MKDDDGHAQAKIRTLLRYAGRRVDMHGEGRGVRPREERARQLAAHHVQRKRDVQALELPDHCLDDVGVPVSSEKQLARQEVGTVQGQIQAPTCRYRYSSTMVVVMSANTQYLSHWP